MPVSFRLSIELYPARQPIARFSAEFFRRGLRKTKALSGCRSGNLSRSRGIKVFPVCCAGYAFALEPLGCSRGVRNYAPLSSSKVLMHKRFRSDCASARPARSRLVLTIRFETDALP